MNMRTGQYQQHKTSLTMNHQLTQSIAILQYTAQELAAYLEHKMLENPLLVVTEPHSEQLPTGTYERSRRRVNEAYDPSDWIEQVSRDQVSLEEHLLSQVNVKEVSGRQIRCLILLIRNLDEHGYLRIPLEELSTPDCPLAEWQNTLEVLHGLEPYGVGARSLQECLWIQACKHAVDSLAEKILHSCFEDFAHKNWKAVSTTLHVSLKEIQRSADYIKTLNPRPALAFQQDHVIPYAVPDVIVREYNGQFVVSSIDASMSKLSLDPQYREQWSHSTDLQVKQYFREKWQEYQWLSRAVEQRKETIRRVMSCIVQKQQACFFYGLEALRPMTMKEVAEELYIHESTVSRTVNGKYVQTPFGTVEMKLFFTSIVSSTEGEEGVSTRKVQQILTDLIEKENKKRPLSDQELAEYLQSNYGFTIARRTVAKYREQLNIPSSSKRRRYDE